MILTYTRSSLAKGCCDAVRWKIQEGKPAAPGNASRVAKLHSVLSPPARRPGYTFSGLPQHCSQQTRRMIV